MFRILFFFCLPICSFSQVNWQWAKSGMGNGNDWCSDIVTDKDGNSYTIGMFYSPTLNLDNITLTNSGSYADIFIAKYNSTGNIIWAKSFGNANNGNGAGAITIDKTNNLYITGMFTWSMIFGNDTLTSAGSTDIFIVKCDSSGNVLWAKSGGGPYVDGGNSLTVDTNNNIVVAGSFMSTMIYGGLMNADNTGQTSDIFVAKYDSSGNFIWAERAGGIKSDGGYSVISDLSNNLYLTGLFLSPTISFGSYILTNADFTATTNDVFITKYNKNGAVLWAKSAGGTQDDIGKCVATDKGSNVYLAGGFSSVSIVFGTDILINNGGSDIFLTKYDSLGNVMWALSSGGSGNDYIDKINITAKSHILLSGSFNSHAISFGSFLLTNKDNSGNTSDIFITRYDTAGNIKQALSAGGNKNDYAVISTDAFEYVYAAGGFNSDTIVFGNYILTNANSLYDVFIAKLSLITGVSEVNTPNNVFNFFPNPSNGKFFISTENEKYQLEVFNSWGEKINKSTITNTSPILDLSLCKSGIYFYTIKNLETFKSNQGKLIIVK